MPLSPNFGGDIAGFGQSNKRGQKAQIFPARVKDIILQPSTDPNSLFAQNKGYPSIGFISFHPLYSVVDSQNKANLVAAPMDVNIRRLPLINEIVLIIQSTDILNEDPQAKKFYYLNNVNVWNSIHHNGFPDLQNLSTTQKSETLLGYLSTENGLTKKPDDTPKDLYLGNTFVEDPQIRNLYPVEGDTIIEGRFGNSIRFSHISIFPSQSVVSPWSKSGRNTRPITIIRNGQTKTTSSVRWTPIFEDIDGDASSIYLTNGQEINMTLASKNLASYNLAATSSATVVAIPNVVVQSPNQAMDQSDEEDLELATSQSLNQNPVTVPSSVTAPLTSSVTQSQAANNSTTVGTTPTASVSPTTETTRTSGPGSSKYEPIPESKLGALTWAGEEVSPIEFSTTYSTIEEDESQYWSKNPQPLEISKELEKALLPPPPPGNSYGNGNGGDGYSSVALTPEALAAAKALALKSGLDVIPGVFEGNNGVKLQLAYLGGQCLEIKAAAAYVVMVAAAKADGVTILLNSGFRPPFQTINGKTASGKNINFVGQYDVRGSGWIGGKGCGEFNDETRRNAPSRCYSPYKAPCGKSKHGEGIAIDINTGGWKSQVPSTTSLTNVYVWMALNGWKYGFIRGVKTETWHFEYHPERAKSGPYGIVGVDKNFQRTMEFKGKLFDLSKITVA
jgi:hypothetical protein